MFTNDGTDTGSDASIESGPVPPNAAGAADYVDVHGAARYLGISPHTLYKLVQKGRVPAGKVGGTWRFSKERLDAFINAGALAARPNVLLLDSDPRDISLITGAASGKVGLLVVTSTLGFTEMKVGGRFDLVILSAALPEPELRTALDAVRGQGEARLVMLVGPGEGEKVSSLTVGGPLLVMRRPPDRMDLDALFTLVRA